jgi:CIC family chloride channel protein
MQEVVENSLASGPSRLSLPHYTVLALALVVLCKIVATGLTIGSGASGGLLFPILFIGGLTGAAYARFWQGLPLPDWMSLTPEARGGMIMVAMGGVFCGCTKTPIASLVLVSELTGSYGLAVPLMLCCASTYLLTTSFTIDEEQVGSIADSPAHRGDFMLNVLEGLKVSSLR